MTDISLNVKLVGASGTRHQGYNRTGDQVVFGHNAGQGATFEFDYNFSTTVDYYWGQFNGGLGGGGYRYHRSGGNRGGSKGNALYLGTITKGNVSNNNIDNIICIAAGGGGSSRSQYGGTATTIHDIFDSRFFGYSGGNGGQHMDLTTPLITNRCHYYSKYT